MAGRAWLLPVLLAGLGALVVAMLGATITDTGPWYHGLVQPRWAPPDSAYGVVWTGIFALAALAGVTAWRATPRASERDILIALLALNGFLNILWSFLFFRLHRPDLALLEVVALWLSVGALILVAWRRSIAAVLMLSPYLLWVTFAGYLNLVIVRLNGPFG